MNNKTTSLRAAKRFQTREPARIEIVGKKTTLHCRMSNLSRTGAFFEVLNANYTPKPGDKVRVTINLKQVNRIHTLNGEVIWFKGLGLGVVFTKKTNLY